MLGQVADLPNIEIERSISSENVFADWTTAEWTRSKNDPDYHILKLGNDKRYPFFSCVGAEFKYCSAILPIGKIDQKDDGVDSGRIILRYNHEGVFEIIRHKYKWIKLSTDLMVFRPDGETKNLPFSLYCNSKTQRCTYRVNLGTD